MKLRTKVDGVSRWDNNVTQERCLKALTWPKKHICETDLLILRIFLGLLEFFFFLVFRIIDKKLYNVNLELQPSTTNKLWLKMKQLQDFYIMKNEKKS